ncbi:hypothetical protein HY732_02560 [Candidatus Uhrbacteria bacterium]|nr:hypothetical protein [Candidatus Uhrbacteria bacterium]
MKIYVLGSNHFMQEMVGVKNRLCEHGFDGTIHPDYEAMVRGDMPEKLNMVKNDRVRVKREFNTLRDHYARILDSEAVLFVNGTKNGIKNYIGGNVLIEMGQAYVNNKKIFFLYGMPSGLPYQDEIDAMDPICLNGELQNIVEHITSRHSEKYDKTDY